MLRYGRKTVIYTIELSLEQFDGSAKSFLLTAHQYKFFRGCNFLEYQLYMIILAIVKEKNIAILSVGIKGKRNTKKAQTQNQARGHTFNMSVKN